MKFLSRAIAGIRWSNHERGAVPAWGGVLQYCIVRFRAGSIECDVRTEVGLEGLAAFVLLASCWRLRTPVSLLRASATARNGRPAMRRPSMMPMAGRISSLLKSMAAASNPKGNEYPAGNCVEFTHSGGAGFHSMFFVLAHEPAAHLRQVHWPWQPSCGSVGAWVALHGGGCITWWSGRCRSGQRVPEQRAGPAVRLLPIAVRPGRLCCCCH